VSWENKQIILLTERKSKNHELVTFFSKTFKSQGRREFSLAFMNGS